MTAAKKGHFSTLKSDSKLLKSDPGHGHISTVEKWPGVIFERWKMTGRVIFQ